MKPLQSRRPSIHPLHNKKRLVNLTKSRQKQEFSNFLCVYSNARWVNCETNSLPPMTSHADCAIAAKVSSTRSDFFFFFFGGGAFPTSILLFLECLDYHVSCNLQRKKTLSYLESLSNWTAINSDRINFRPFWGRHGLFKEENILLSTASTRYALCHVAGKKETRRKHKRVMFQQNYWNRSHYCAKEPAPLPSPIDCTVSNKP